jgi:probable phosphoglycerate mutase
MSDLTLNPSLLIYLTRHGETQYNRQNRFNGRTDSPLTELGVSEAHRQGRVLGEVLEPDRSLRIVSSPLGRAVHTAEIIRDQIRMTGYEIETDPRLTEISFGEWEGLTMEEIQSRFPGEWDKRHNNMWTYVVPGGESYEMVARRAADWLGEAHGPMLVVTHGGVERILRGLYGRLPTGEIGHLPEPQDLLFMLSDGQITKL